MLEILLAALAVSAAVGIRIALPTLMIGLLYSDNLWADVPVLSHIPPQIVLGVLVSWSLAELFLSKERSGQRLLQSVQLLFSPFVGAIAGFTVARTAQADERVAILLGLVGGLLALVLQLVQVGWFYRLRGIPVWVIFLQDLLCVLLVLLAFDAPEQGGVIALLMLWLAIRSSKAWQNWYQQQSEDGDHRHPRQGKHEPD